MKYFAYHWTTNENASKILLDGLRKRSYVCKRKEDWNGEVCFIVEFDKPLPFDDEGIWSWQLVTSEVILPFRLKIL